MSTRQAEVVMRAFGIESLSSSQVSRAARLLDAELDSSRTRPLGEVKHLILDARHEKMRHGGVVRAVWNAGTLAKAEAALAELVAGHRDNAPKLATWLEENVPEGLAVFTLPEPHRRRMRIPNPMERAVQQELKRRTAWVSLRRAVLPLEGPLILLSPERGLPPAARQRHPRRERREMGLRHQGLHQVGMPGCLTRSQQNFQTSGC